MLEKKHVTFPLFRSEAAAPVLLQHRQTHFPSFVAVLFVKDNSNTKKLGIGGFHAPLQISPVAAIPYTVTKTFKLTMLLVVSKSVQCFGGFELVMPRKKLWPRETSCFDQISETKGKN